MFESGISKVQELERYVSDDVERYGARLAGLEEKLITAYRESVRHFLNNICVVDITCVLDRW